MSVLLKMLEMKKTAQDMGTRAGDLL